MVFSSIEFMFRFLPIFLIVYFAAAPKYRNIILLIGSLIFYGVGEPSYIILMILSILVNHLQPSTSTPHGNARMTRRHPQRQTERSGLLLPWSLISECYLYLST